MSKIEWTEKTWNPLAGCTRVSPGCQHCYAERMAKRQIAIGNKNYEGTVDKHGRWTGRINLIPDALDKPLHWRKPRMVFVNSMSDLFHEGVPLEFIDKVFVVIKDWRAAHHTFQILTKRPERMERYFRSRTWARPSNVHLGVSVENQETSDERIPWLLKTPAAVRWVSYEPALGPVDFFMVKPHWFWAGSGIDGIVMGCESGPGARPMDLDWVRSVRDQCQEAGVSFFFKQMLVNGKKVGLPELDGRTWDEWPDAVAQEDGDASD